MNRFLKTSSVGVSLAVHLLIAGIILLGNFHLPNFFSAPIPIEVAFLQKAPSKNNLAKSQKLPASRIASQYKKSVLAIDLSPSYMKSSLSEIGKHENLHASDEGSALAVLNVPPRVAQAFDHLAAQMNRHLDYPDILFEQNVQGTASLDLRFNTEGRIDENESLFSGSHFAVRGLLVKAARLAIVEWYESDAYRLKRDEFRGQHFHVDFQISYVNESESSLTRKGDGSYDMIRRRFKNECANPLGVDLLCVALKTKGAIENLLTDSSRIHFELLKDKLNALDELQLHGINALIASASS